MYQIENYVDNGDIKILNRLGPFTVIEYQRDLSVMPTGAMQAYYCNAINVRKRQVLCDLSKASITLQAAAMQWSAGDVNATTGIEGVVFCCISTGEFHFPNQDAIEITLETVTKFLQTPTSVQKVISNVFNQCENGDKRGGNI